MSSRTVITIAILITLATGHAATAGVLVAFRDKASISSSLVTLGDVADLHATDAADEQRLSAVILGPAPAAGRDSNITFETVRSRLLAAGVNLADVEFSGPAKIPVSAVDSGLPASSSTSDGAGSNSGSRIEKVIVQAIRRYLAVQSGGESFDVAATITADAARLLAGAATRGVDVSGGRAPWSGPQTFVLQVIDAQEQVQVVQVDCKVTARPMVLAAKVAMTKGHVIGPDDLVWKTAESDADAACVTNPQELLGHETQQSLRVGETIRRNAVKTLPLVRSGQFVTVSSRRPGLAVQRVMKAKADGGLGEVIAFQTLETRKTVLARVTGLLEADVVDSTEPSMPGPPNAEQRAARDARIAGPPPEVVPQTPPTSAAATNDIPRVHVNPVRPLSVPVSMADQRP